MAAVLVDTEVYARKLREAGLDPRFAEIMAEAATPARPLRAVALPDATMWQQSVVNRLGGLHGDIAGFQAKVEARFDSMRDAKSVISDCCSAPSSPSRSAVGFMAHGLK